MPAEIGDAIKKRIAKFTKTPTESRRVAVLLHEELTSSQDHPRVADAERRIALEAIALDQAPLDRPQSAEIGEEFARFLPLANSVFVRISVRKVRVELLPKGFETAAQRDDEDVNSWNVMAVPRGPTPGALDTFKTSDAEAKVMRGVRWTTG